MVNGYMLVGLKNIKVMYTLIVKSMIVGFIGVNDSMYLMVAFVMMKELENFSI